MLPRPTSHSKALGPGVAGPELAVATSAVLDAPPRPTPQQPLSGAENFMVDPVALDSAGPRQHTQYPYVTGTSVLAIKYKDGVMVACDTLGAYGSTKRYKSVERIKRINDHVVVAASGELSDFQYIIKLLDELTTGVCCVCPCMRCFRVVHVCVCPLQSLCSYRQQHIFSSRAAVSWCHYSSGCCCVSYAWIMLLQRKRRCCTHSGHMQVQHQLQTQQQQQTC